MYKKQSPNPSRPNAPIGRHQRIGYGVSNRTATSPSIKTAKAANGKSVQIRTRSRR